MHKLKGRKKIKPTQQAVNFEEHTHRHACMCAHTHQPTHPHRASVGEERVNTKAEVYDKHTGNKMCETQTVHAGASTQWL